MNNVAVLTAVTLFLFGCSSYRTDRPEVMDAGKDLLVTLTDAKVISDSTIRVSVRYSNNSNGNICLFPGVGGWVRIFSADDQSDELINMGVSGNDMPDYPFSYEGATQKITLQSGKSVNVDFSVNTLWYNGIQNLEKKGNQKILPIKEGRYKIVMSGYAAKCSWRSWTADDLKSTLQKGSTELNKQGVRRFLSDSSPVVELDFPENSGSIVLYN